MGRVWSLVFAFLGNEQPINDYNSLFHQDVHVFAERGLKKAYQSSVIISAANDTGEASRGSGNYMQVNSHKFILTAHHVVAGKKNIFVTEKSGHTYSAYVRYVDEGNDIAILKVYQNLNFTKSIGAEVDKSGRGLGLRSNRYTMLIENLNVLKIQEEKETGVCDISSAENFFKLL